MSLTIHCTRNGLVETVHPVSAVLIEGGAVRWSVGEDIASFWRSASKPFQLLNSLNCLPDTLVDSLDERALAIGTASHSGQTEHTDAVASLLTRFDLGAGQLQCGTHPPSHEATARTVPVPTVLHNNCSGKHTFMLAACAAQGWQRDYRPPDHPLQARNHALLDDLAGMHHGVGVDGCSVPTFHTSLSGQARAWAAIAEAMAGRGDPRLGRIGWAMQREPFLVSGTHRLDLAVCQASEAPIACKIGAEGLFCIASPSGYQGLAVKVHTGNTEALAVAVRAVLAKVGLPLRGPWFWDTVRNVRNAEVGERRAVWGIATPPSS